MKDKITTNINRMNFDSLILIKSTASISKKQYPGIQKEEIINYFFNKLKDQHHTTLIKKGEFINFTISLFDISISRFYNKWGNYSEGEFKIFEEDQHIIIYFRGKIKRGVYMSIIISSIPFFMSLITISKSILLPLIPLFFCAILIGFTVIYEKIKLPYYLTGQLYKIKEKIRDKEFI
jgi:hypothetical protein